MKISRLAKKVEEGTMNPADDIIESSRLLPSGSTLLNLALAESHKGGYVAGTVVNLVGDSSAGKSFLLWSLFAEISHNEEFDDYSLIYDEPEAALQFKLKKLFGKKTAKRVEILDEDHRSETVQELYQNIQRRVKIGKPFIYGLDSFDSLKDASETDDTPIGGKGGWKTGKAIASSELLRRVVRKIKGSESLVIIVSQTRDKIGAMWGNPKTRSGGNALRFYSTHEFWLSVLGHIKRRELDTGVNVLARFGKNKKTGKLRNVELAILYDYGVDDIGSMVSWLLKEKFWVIKKNTIIAPNFIDATEKKLIQYIEENNLEKKLQKFVYKCWKNREESVRSKRKPRYED